MLYVGFEINNLIDIFKACHKILFYGDLATPGKGIPVLCRREALVWHWHLLVTENNTENFLGFLKKT